MPIRFALSAGAAAHVSLTEIAVVVTNVLIVLATLLLTYATLKDSQKTAREVVKAESRNTRLLTRLLRNNRRNSKHAKGSS